MKRTALILGAVIATALVVWVLGPFTFYASVVPVLGPVLPRPEGVPRQAKASYDFKSGMNWTWTRNLAHSCAAWSGNERWAHVTLLVGSRCDGSRRSGLRDGRGLSHLSFEDHLEFQGYWPWSAELHSKLLVFDEKGMIKTVLPCPYTLTAEQIEGMRTVAAEAYARAETDGERRVLARVRQRLAALSGVGLATGQFGCTDSTARRDVPLPRYDSWKPEAP